MARFLWYTELEHKDKENKENTQTFKMYIQNELNLWIHKFFNQTFRKIELSSPKMIYEIKDDPIIQVYSLDP